MFVNGQPMSQYAPPCRGPTALVLFALLLLSGCALTHGDSIPDALAAPREIESADNTNLTATGAWQSEPDGSDPSRERLSDDIAKPAIAVADENDPFPPNNPDARQFGADGTLRDVWGVFGIRLFPVGDHIASNGIEFKQLFDVNSSFNLWLWRRERVYIFMDTVFWGQKAAPGITNPSQGKLDFSKREFDLTIGFAWNYYGRLEARAFAYSFNNLNRGDSNVSPSGFNDGVGLENRWYLNSVYDNLGTSAYDQARASFLSAGFFPSKSMVSVSGDQFKPGPFVRAYLTLDLYQQQYYLFADTQLIGNQNFRPTLLNLDVGLAARPFLRLPRLEFRIGSQDQFDLNPFDAEISAYFGIRYVY
jgi:hypothetical protein